MVGRYFLNGESFLYRELLTIDGSKVTTETGIPLARNVVLPGVKSDGSDVRLGHLNGTPIPREIECVGVPSTDAVMFHYPFNTVASIDSQFYVYWGNDDLNEPASDSTYGSEAVWSDYEAVWHMNIAPTGSLIDATGNGHTATPSGLSAGDLVDGDYGKAISFGSGKYYSISTIDLNIFSLSCQQKFDDTVEQRKSIIGNSGGGGPLMHLTYDANENYNAWVNLEYTSDINYLWEYTRDTNWNTFSYTKSGTSLVVYQNGISKLDQTVNSAEDLNALYIARSRDFYFYGDISELRISNALRSENYVQTEHKNLNNPTASGTDPFYLADGPVQHKRRTPQYM